MILIRGQMRDVNSIALNKKGFEYNGLEPRSHEEPRLVPIFLFAVIPFKVVYSDYTPPLSALLFRTIFKTIIEDTAINNNPMNGKM